MSLQYNVKKLKGAHQHMDKVVCFYSIITQPQFKFCSFSAPGDIPKADEVRTLIKDIWDIRMAKLRKSIDQMVIAQEPHAQVYIIT